MWVDYWGPKGKLAPSKMIGGPAPPPAPLPPLPTPMGGTVWWEWEQHEMQDDGWIIIAVSNRTSFTVGKSSATSGARTQDRVSQRLTYQATGAPQQYETWLWLW